MYNKLFCCGGQHQRAYAAAVRRAEGKAKRVGNEKYRYAHKLVPPRVQRGKAAVFHRGYPQGSDAVCRVPPVAGHFCAVTHSQPLPFLCVWTP